MREIGTTTHCSCCYNTPVPEVIRVDQAVEIDAISPEFLVTCATADDSRLANRRAAGPRCPWKALMPARGKPPSASRHLQFERGGQGLLSPRTWQLTSRRSKRRARERRFPAARSSTLRVTRHDPAKIRVPTEVISGEDHCHDALDQVSNTGAYRLASFVEANTHTFGPGLICLPQLV